jgi:uncharacterized protein
LNGQAGAPPTAESRRIEVVDGLRGFALLGILVVNITYFATAFTYDRGIEDPAFASTLDELARWIVSLLFETKFYLLFSFLFGYSFTLQMESAARQGAGFVARMLRRLSGLFIIGAMHATLLWHGDILTTYALTGLVLLLMRNVAPRTAVRTALGILATIAVLAATAGVALSTEPSVAFDYGAAKAEAVAATEAYRGSFADVLEQRFEELPWYLGFILLFQAPTALAAFLIGLAAGKLRVLANPAAYRRQFQRLLVWGAPIGLAGATAFAVLSDDVTDESAALLGLAVDVVTAPLLTASYVAAFVLIALTARGSKVSRALAPMGRMALSNYLLQSLVCGFVFFGYGLGLIGHLGPFAVLLVAFAIFLAQIPLSAWWMRRHQYGLLEWLLRAFTNWTVPRWRRVRPLPAPAPSPSETIP